jgi:protein-tyrosine phosphatase
LLLLALGVPEADVIEHYLESNKHRVARAERLAQLARAGFDPAILEPFFTVHEAYARAAIDAVTEHWGDHDAYLRQCLGIDENRLARFRDAMLVD